MKKLSVPRWRLAFIALYFISALILYLVPYSELFNRIIAISVLLLSFVLVYRCRNSTLFRIVALFIAYSNYSIVIGIYLFPEMRPRYLYPQITDIEVYGIGIAMMFLFLAAILCFLPQTFSNGDEPFACQFVKPQNHNALMFYGMGLLFLMVTVLGYSRSSGGRGSSSALYEYGLIFLILMFYFSGGKKINTGICFALAALYVLTSLMNGTRIEALECMLILYFCGVRIKIPNALLIPLFIVGLVMFNLIGMFRGNNGSLMQGIADSFTRLIDSKLVFDTCTHAYFPALCMIEQFKHYDLRQAAYFLIRFLQTIVLGQSRVENGDLIQYVSKFYYHNFGGVSVGFFYVWFSYLGSLIYGAVYALYARLSNTLQKNSTPLKLGIGLYFAVTVPRWYLYGPWSFTRGILICIVVLAGGLMVKTLFAHRSGQERSQS